MNNRDEMDAFLMFIRAVNGEKDVIGNMEREGNERAARYTQVAKDMTPAKEEWEKLGFKFTEIPGDDVLYQAELPEGWTMEATNQYNSEIYDERGLLRASMYYKSSFYDKKAYMYLVSRYSVRAEFNEAIGCTEVYFGSNLEKLFIAGKYIESETTFEQKNKYLELATKFGEENYPNYQDVTAYWNDENNKQLKLK